jgi:hypothetical protein
MTDRSRASWCTVLNRRALVHTASMSPWVLPIAIPAGILLFIVNMANGAGFQEFCRLVARREGRLKELNEPSADELDNAFESQQRTRLRRREYRAFADTQITALGDRLLRRRWQLMLLNIAAVAAFVGLSVLPLA